MPLNHIEKVTMAVRYIESHLTEKVDLNMVAKAVHYSKYHLHRIFSKTVGLTIHEYLLRRQLTEAAKLLVFSERSIIDIAMLSGYESQQAFTKSFTDFYKQPPNKYRENEKFYPLQLKFHFEGSYNMLKRKENNPWDINFAKEKDIPSWMNLVRLVIDGFPYLQEEEHIQVVKQHIHAKQALILKEDGMAIGIMLFSYQTGSIEFMGTHPLYRDRGVPKAFLDKVMNELVKEKTISITTYREGDKADTGHRKAIKELGFAEAELLVEFGYPTQRFVLPKEEIPFPDEVKHLEELNLKLNISLANANASVEHMDKEYMNTKRYMVENRGEIDPHEMFQNELQLKQIDHQGAISVKTRDKYAKLLDSPYFARIDFIADGYEKPDFFYIGRFAYSYENELLISDWRSPVASMFYDCEVGAAKYHAPMGKVSGELTRKRQFKIKNGILEYTLESSVNIQDNVLQKELSQTSDEKMKSIISTIQKEQNQIVRNEKSGTMIIQGVAGSGKTSIALHRIAYLLYRFKDRLSAKNVTIISPNKVFGDYISNVLPELGEEPIYELSFSDIARIQLDKNFDFEEDKDPLETHDEKWCQRIRFKSTLDFVKQLDAYIEQLPNIVFEPKDYTYGCFTAKTDMIKERFLAYSRYPILSRLQMIADDIYDRFDTDNVWEEEIPRSRTILKSLKTMLKVKNTLALYKGFYKQMAISHMLVMPDKKTLEWADVYPFLYLHAAFEGLQESKIIKHLVIDEMQDYTPIQYAVINKLFQCQKTILGDFGQFINPNHLHTLKDMLELYEEAQLIELQKSYRSTYQIISFAKQLQKEVAMEAIERHGEPPAVIHCHNTQEELVLLQKQIKIFSENKYSSLGIIAKTNKQAKQLYDLLLGNNDVHLISPESTSYKNGVSITSIQMSKGLEFDEVIIPDVDSTHYITDYDRSLLYIACTRAMHRLTLMYTGEITNLLEVNETPPR